MERGLFLELETMKVAYLNKTYLSFRTSMNIVLMPFLNHRIAMSMLDNNPEKSSIGNI